MVHTDETGSPASHNICFLSNDFIGGVLHNFGLFLIEISIRQSFDSKLQVNSWQSEETICSKADVVQVDLPSLGYRSFD